MEERYRILLKALLECEELDYEKLIAIAGITQDDLDHIFKLRNTKNGHKVYRGEYWDHAGSFKPGALPVAYIVADSAEEAKELFEAKLNVLFVNPGYELQPKPCAKRTLLEDFDEREKGCYL